MLLRTEQSRQRWLGLIISSYILHFKFLRVNIYRNCSKMRPPEYTPMWIYSNEFVEQILKICNCLCSYLITVLISNLVRRASYLCRDIKKVRSPVTRLAGCFLITFDIHFSDTMFVFAKLRLNIIPPVCIPKFAFISYILERLRYILNKVCLRNCWKKASFYLHYSTHTL